ncbi:MAG: cupin domain-containing protein [Dehalococcoidia bacterium]
MKYIGHYHEEDLPPPHSPDQGRHVDWSLKMMVDHQLGAHHLRMFIVQFAPGGTMKTHDHPFEEAYLVLEGEIVITLAGEEHRLGPGDYAWAGVGAPHSFRNEGNVTMRFLEVQAPPPPAQMASRWLEDWVQREAETGTHGPSPLEAAGRP